MGLPELQVESYHTHFSWWCKSESSLHQVSGRQCSINLHVFIVCTLQTLIKEQVEANTHLLASLSWFHAKAQPTCCALSPGESLPGSTGASGFQEHPQVLTCTSCCVNRSAFACDHQWKYHLVMEVLKRVIFLIKGVGAWTDHHKSTLGAEPAGAFCRLGWRVTEDMTATALSMCL